MKKVFTILTLIIVAALAGGCMPANKAPAPVPVLTPPPLPDSDPLANPGSLFSSNNADYLFADNRARRVGDIVLVTVNENTNGKNTVNTKANRNTETNFGVSNFATGMITGAIPFMDAWGFQSGKGDVPMIKSGAKNDFKGDAETERKSKLTTSVAARIIRVLPNKVFQVEGAREVRVNEDTQILVVRGLVRHRDIGPDNSVDSAMLANAKVELYGRGVLADKQSPGWLSRLLDNIWPF